MASSLECGVCFSGYNSNDHRPKSLPCGHTICSSCVKDNLKAKEGKMNCPFCRNPCGAGVKTLDDFPTTFALLDLLNNDERDCPSKTLSPREKEKESLQQKKQAECDRTRGHISKCNEHLQKLIHVKETQESAIHCISLRKDQLLENYQRQQKILEEEENKATSMKSQVEDIVDEGNDIVKGLEALQDRVMSASSLLGLNMASQDVQRYYTASEEWVTSRVKSILKEDTHLTKESLMELSQKIKELKNMRDTSRRAVEANKVYQKILCNGTLNVKKNMNGVVRYGRIEVCGDHLIMKDLQWSSPDDGATVLDFQDVMALIPRPCVVLLMLTHRGTSLGHLHIHLDGQSVPRCIQQFLDLSTGSSFQGGWRNSGFDRVWDKGQPGERVSCAGYKNAFGLLKSDALYDKEGWTRSTKWTKGAVYGYSGQYSAFVICTKDDPKVTLLNPVIGHVTSGMTILQTAAAKGDDYVKHIVFSECAVIIGSTE